MLNQRKFLPLISMSVIFSIVCIIVMARGSLPTEEEFRTSTIETSIAIIENEKLNESEKIIVNMLYQEFEQRNYRDRRVNDIRKVYVKYLENYFASPGINVRKEKLCEIVDLMIGWKRIMILEKESDLKKMSFDARRITIHIGKQIYERCGLKIVFSTQGEIIKITDELGTLRYSKVAINQGNFNYNWLTMIVIVWFTLFGLCILIAKKNLLFIKNYRTHTKHNKYNGSG